MKSQSSSETGADANLQATSLAQHRRTRIIERLADLADDALLEGFEVAAMVLRKSVAALQAAEPPAV